MKPEETDVLKCTWQLVRQAVGTKPVLCAREGKPCPQAHNTRRILCESHFDDLQVIWKSHVAKKEWFRP